MALTYLRAGTVKRIHVDRQVLARNRKTGGREPAWTVQTSKGPIKGYRVEVHGHLVGDQRSPQLRCGARMYLETRAAVEVSHP